MQGSYQMLADNGAHFDAPIQPFRLACPEFCSDALCHRRTYKAVTRNCALS